ncbi:amidohydrolase [Aureitalea sp. L0-47]|uniref:amidohydrolase n=1 Tax=Aureitalea sp. L0-47 TaxID=2816962 RepID=UPI0022388428|nr:amidohydrolase [Aureitalea sp. L0-47]MCW5520685.1 amidohydrolase [Aureitalea sp. L0-47]
MKYIPSLLLIVCCLFSCSSEKIPADLLVTNATVYTIDDSFGMAEAFVVKDGKILETGTANSLSEKYKPTETFDADGNVVLPGLIDAHAHLLNLGVTLQQVNLVGTKSYREVLERVVQFQNEKKSEFILGRGWDQNDWEVKEFPTKKELDSLFPDTPVALRRIDGHAMLCNSKALEMAGITSETKMPGGEVIVDNGEPTGVLIDAAMRPVGEIIPEEDAEFYAKAFTDAENICFSHGLTTVNDAGLSREAIELLDSLQQTDEMKIRVYAMAANYPENLDHFLSNGIVKTERLNVRSVKVYADGALGSRGAAMKAPYSDQAGHFGLMITTEAQLDSLAQRIAAAGYQMNTHAIGDSANVAVLRSYSKALEGKTDARWKVEHAQVIDLPDFDYFSMNIIPSVQPTHATSDMYWAEDRVGPDRIKGAYAFKTLLNQAGIVALGTDFPVEKVNPMHTFYAAVARKDLDNYPEGGYRMEEALSRQEALKGMTIWAAFSNFEEKEKGSIEVGKFADFVVLDRDIMKVQEDSIPGTKVLATFVNGEKVFGVD